MRTRVVSGWVKNEDKGFFILFLVRVSINFWFAHDRLDVDFEGYKRWKTTRRDHDSPHECRTHFRRALLTRSLVSARGCARWLRALWGTKTDSFTFTQARHWNTHQRDPRLLVSYSGFLRTMRALVRFHCSASFLKCTSASLTTGRTFVTNNEKRCWLWSQKASTSPYHGWS